MARAGTDVDVDLYLATLGEELRTWPYVIHALDETLDIELIEGRGKQLLFQALTVAVLSPLWGPGCRPHMAG